MKKILLPTDFSENSWSAIDFALQLFKNETCTFYLLNTYTPVIYNLEEIVLSTTEYNLEKIIRENSINGLKAIKNRIENDYKNPKHNFTEISSFNTLIGEINELLKDYIMDFIVMGTKGATGAKEVLFGSNTVHVFKSAKCPVLAIPDTFYFEVPHEILFPSDYNIDFKTEQIQPITAIAKQFKSRVNILHVFQDEGLTERQEKCKTDLEVYFKDTAYLFHSVEDKNIPKAITEFQSRARINLLVMVNNTHSFFENIFFKNKINQIGLHLNIPFLVIPTK
jgi:nucleotide-binding universal stress UspA family protein